MFEEFLKIAKELNHLGITPLLMGSVGLEKRTNQSWDARDIDIHVPSDPRGWEAPDEERIHQADELIAMMASLGYQFEDLHEFAFQKGGITVEFGGLDSLPSFAGIPLTELEIQKEQGVTYYLPNLEQYLKIYQSSSKDSYRADKNNQKDFAKIAYLEKALEK